MYGCHSLVAISEFLKYTDLGVLWHGSKSWKGETQKKHQGRSRRGTVSFVRNVRERCDTLLQALPEVKQTPW